MVQSKTLRPDWLPAVALSAALAAAMLAWNPAGRRPRRPGLPHRTLRARRPRDLERQLVRRPLHAHLQLPLPTAGGAARAAGGRGALGDLLLLSLRPPRARPLGRGGALGDALVRGRRRHPARRRPAHLRPRGRLRARQPARHAGGPRLDRHRGRRLLRPLQPGRRRLPGRRRRRRRARARPPRQPRRRLGRLDRARPRPDPQPRLPRAGPVPLQLLLLHRDPPLVRLGPLHHPRPARRGAPAALGARRLPARRDARLAGAQRDGRQRGPARRPLRRPGPGRGRARPPPARLRLVPRPVHGRRPLLAGDRQRQPDRPQRRRSLDRLGLLRPVARWLRENGGGPGIRVEVPPTANHWESAYLAPRRRARPRLAAPARHDPRQPLLRRRAPHRRHLQLLAARQRDPLRRPPRRAARLLLRGRAAADPARPALPHPALDTRPTGASTRSATPSRWSSRSAPRRRGCAGSASRASPSTSSNPGQFLVRVNFTQYWSIARGEGCLHAPRRLDPGPRRPPRRLPRRRRLLPSRAWNAVTGARKTC